MHGKGEGVISPFHYIAHIKTKEMTLKTINISILVLLSYLFSGCIYEELPPCATKLHFVYTLNPSGENLFGSTVDDINVYVFDQHDRFIRSYRDSGAIVSNFYTLELPLSKDPISVVAVGVDADGFYQTGSIKAADFTSALITGKTTLQDFRVKLSDKTIETDSPGALLVGHITGLLPTGAISDYTVDMTNNLNQINLQISGLSHVQYTPVFSVINGRYNYANMIPSDARIRYYHPIATVKSGNDDFVFSTLKLPYDAEIILKLYDADGNNALAGFEGVDLMKLIKKSPDFSSQIDLDRETTYNLRLNFDGSTMVSIVINGWEIVLTKPEV